MPFCCGDLELTPHSCFSKSSCSLLVILQSPLGRRSLTTVNASPGAPVPDLEPFSGARRTVIIDWDTFHANRRRKVRRLRTLRINMMQI
jgi:hypothetical protein